MRDLDDPLDAIRKCHVDLRRVVVFSSWLLHYSN
jgi:hypothetical protein